LPLIRKEHKKQPLQGMCDIVLSLPEDLNVCIFYRTQAIRSTKQTTSAVHI